MKKNLNTTFILCIVFSSITILGSMSGIVLAGVFMLPNGQLATGIATIICLSLITFLAMLCMAIAIGWKHSSTSFTKYDNDKPDFYEQKKIDEEKERVLKK